MSEYQYYEFVAIDGPISDEGLRYAKGCSSRANVSRVRWQNTYTFGDFHGSVDKLLKYYDAHFYIANWGTALNERAGSHSWSYVAPSEAATELLTEAVEDRVEEMERSLKLGLLALAETLCAGIVEGLCRARDTKSDGALGWAVDFPADEAGFVVRSFLKGCRPTSRMTAYANLMQVLTERAPEWVKDLQRVAKQVDRPQG
jgi:hypothetical protein